MQQDHGRAVALNRGEWRESVHGLASVVFEADGKTPTAIGTPGLAEGVHPTESQQYGCLMKKLQKVFRGHSPTMLSIQPRR